MSIIVVSDTHLGYEQSKHVVFENFLDNLLHYEGLTDLVILGDFVDMWRRDVSGLFLDFTGIVSKILALKDKTKVTCIAGNHDYHLLRLNNNGKSGWNYPLQFGQNCELSVDGTTYRFMHGYEFDKMQNELMMELLCYTMSDEAGNIRSEFWSGLTSITTDIKLLENFFRFHNNTENSGMLAKLKTLKNFMFADVGNLMKDPLKRNWSVDEVEKDALKQRETKFADKTLIFGHTHVPFFDPENKIVNSGSWVFNDNNIPFNTFIEIDENGIQLKQVLAADDNKIVGINNITNDMTRVTGTA